MYCKGSESMLIDNENNNEINGMVARELMSKGIKKYRDIYKMICFVFPIM